MADDDEFDFSDGLDLLHADQLAELETQAIRSTQHQNHTSNANDNQGGFVPGSRKAQAHVHAAPHPPSSDYGLDDDGGDGDEVVVEVDGHSMPTNRVYTDNNGAGNGNGNGNGSGNGSGNMAPAPSPWVAVAAPQPARGAPGQVRRQSEGQAGPLATMGVMDVDQPPQRSQGDLDQVLARLRHIEQEKARLATENRKLKADNELEKHRALQKAGEADTLRRRQNAAQKEAEQRERLLLQAHKDDLARLKAELQRANRDREQVQTNNMFQEHDRLMDADRAKQKKKLPLRTANPSPSRTPKRAKSRPYGDGFDDDDIVLASPSKAKDKAKPATPKQGQKRKRPIADQSPIPALQLSGPRQSFTTAESFGDSFEAPEAPEGLPAVLPGADHNTFQKLPFHDHRFEIFHRIVNQYSSNGEDRVLEALTQHAFPSDPSKKLSSIIYDDVATFGSLDDEHALSVNFCRAFFSLWERCIKEAYYAPVTILLDAIHFILACEPALTAIAVTEHAVPQLMAAIDLVAIPISKTARRETEPSVLAARDSPKNLAIRRQIDVLDCLDLLYLLAMSCVASPTEHALTTFWTTMHHDFLLTMTQRTQPLDQIAVMLKILSTSCLENTFGSIAAEAPDRQGSLEHDMVDRLTNMLAEKHVPLPGVDAKDVSPEPYAPAQICELCARVVGVLTTIAHTAHGSRRLAQNQHCIARLVQYLDSQISSLYAKPLSPLKPYTTSAINATMRLIYHIVQSNKDTLDFKQKLNAVAGANHMYIVSFTRLAFLDGLVLEEGIEPEATEAAHRILDDGLFPEEGEELLRVFSSMTTGDLEGIGTDEREAMEE